MCLSIFAPFMVDHIEIELKAAIKATSREEHLSVRRQMRIDLDTHSLREAELTDFEIKF